MTDLEVDVADGVAILTLNRPEQRNAYTRAMGEALSAAYRACDEDDGVRAIVLRGLKRVAAALAIPVLEI